MQNTTEWTEGYETAKREMAADGWNSDFCVRYLTAIGALTEDRATESEYGRGHNAAIREGI